MARGARQGACDDNSRDEALETTDASVDSVATPLDIDRRIIALENHGVLLPSGPFSSAAKLFIVLLCYRSL